jgi:hypothetical protein
MRRSSLLVFVALLLLGASLGSATPPTPFPPSTDLPVLDLSVTNMTAAMPSCAKTIAEVDPLLPQWMTTSDQYCGACSPVPCALGAARYTRCGPFNPNEPKWCDYTGDICPGEGTPTCQCVPVGSS